MWSVIRKRQGLDANQPPEMPRDAYARHQQCILLHEAKPFVPPMSPTDFSKAYDEMLYVKVHRWLLDERENVRLQALDHIIELYIERREHAVQSLRYNMLPVLLATLKSDENPMLRERAGHALELLLREVSTQRLMSASLEVDLGANPKEKNYNYFLCLTSSLQDSNDDVVISGLRAIIACHAYHNSFQLTSVLIECSLIRQLIGLMHHANPIVRAFACSATIPIFHVKEAYIDFLKLDGVAAVTQALETDEDILIAEAAQVVSFIAEYPQGRREAVMHGTLERLRPHLSNSNLTVRVAVTAAAAQITILEPAKTQALEVGVCEVVCSQIDQEDERDVLMFLLRLLYSLAELPAARKVLQPCAPRLVELEKIADDDEGIMMALKNARVLLAKPK